VVIPGTTVQVGSIPPGLVEGRPMTFSTPDGVVVHSVIYGEFGKVGDLRPIYRSVSVFVADDARQAEAVRAGDLAAPTISSQTQAGSPQPELVEIGTHRAVMWPNALTIPAPTPDERSVPGPATPSKDRVVTRYEIAGSKSIVQIAFDGIPDDEVRTFIASMEVD
jgi:hypothetical protein